MLLEFIRSSLQDLHGDSLAIILKSLNQSGSTRIILYDIMDLIDQVEEGNKSPNVNILGTATVENFKVTEVRGDSRVGYIAKKYANMESIELNKLIKNHYRMLHYLRKHDVSVQF